MAFQFRPHVLVVDDDASVREALTAALGERYAVHAVPSGADARSILSVHPVAVIILDALLGENEHGLDLVETFRGLSRAPIVLLTGHGSEALAIRALRAKVEEYLTKPISLPDLLAVLHRLVPETPRAADFVARVRRYLDEHPAKRFRIGELAGHFGVTEAHLRRLFRNAYGVTPRQYATEIRVRQAADLLRTTERSVKHIALEVGFSNMVVFRRAFRRVMGDTPLACRVRTR